MKHNYFKLTVAILLLIFSILTSFAQQAVELDTKSVRLPRYANLSAITSAITSPQQGMLVYNVDTGSNWNYNGTAWVNTVGVVSAPLVLTSPDNTLDVLTTGTGSSAGSFYNTNTANIVPAIKAQTNGNGTAIYAKNDGTGSAGDFKIFTATNSSDVLKASTDGTGRAGDFRINNTGNSSTALYAQTEGSGSALYGYTNGSGIGVRGHAAGTLGRAGDFAILNGLNAQSALSSVTFGTGAAGDFTISNTANTVAAVRSQSNGSGQVISATMTGTGISGSFVINNLGNNDVALESRTNGTGSAFSGINNSSTNPTATLSNFNSAGLALETSGGVKLGGPNMGSPSPGKVLTATNGFGNATWQAIPPVTAPLSLTAVNFTTLTAISSGSGTAANFSSTSGYAVLIGTGNVGIGTATPTAKLDVVGQTKINGNAGIALDVSNSSSSNATLKATNGTNLGTAIDITGGIKVSGTNRAAFRITTNTAASGGNTTGNTVQIPNTTLANDADDILIVTHSYTPTNTYLNKAFGVFWTGTNWRIYLEDVSTMPNNITFNMLVIKQ